MPRIRPTIESAHTRGVIAKDVVIGGGQGQYITLGISHFAYDTVTNIFSLDATVQNDLREPLGTPDGVTVTGIKVFVVAFYPTVGSGTVSIANADGTGTFTAANQPYWLYNQMLAPAQVSSTRNWQLYIAPTVDNFYFAIETYAGFPAEYTIPASAPDTTVDSIYANSNITNSDPNYAGPHLFNAVGVDFARDTSIADRALAVAAIGGTVVGGWDYINNDGFYVIHVPGDSTGAGLAAAISTLESLPQVATASPEFILDSSALEYRRPRDQFQPSDWHWNPDNPGVDTTWAFSRVEAPLAWGCDTGSTTTQVAVVDNNFPHVTDLDTNAAGSTFTSLANTRSDHGVAMASIIGAQGDNRVGMAGMMWRARLRYYDLGGSPFDESPVNRWTPDRAIHELAHAVTDGARVVNLSQTLSPGYPLIKFDSTHSDAVADAEKLNAELDTAILRVDSVAPQRPVYVISAGNESCGTDRTNPWFDGYATLETLFPGRALVVEATDTRDNRPNCANHGQYVNIAAPGDSVMALKVDGTIGLVNGSSPSAALVTGAVGLLFAFDSSMSPATAVGYVIQGATNGGRHTNDATPVPILNAYESLELAAARSGAPLCGTRLWSSSGFIYAQRGNGATEAIMSTGSAPAWNVIAMHGGHRVEYTTVHGRYGAEYRGGHWQSPVQVLDSATALSQAPISGPQNSLSGPFFALPPANGDTTQADSILGGTGRSAWGYNHDGDSAAMLAVHVNGPGGVDTVFVIRGPTQSIVNGTGPTDTVGSITYPSASNVDYGCAGKVNGACTGDFIQPTRLDFMRLAYAPHGDRILVAIDHDNVSVNTTGYISDVTSVADYEFLAFTIDIVSASVEAYQFSLPSKNRSTLTVPTGNDIYWWSLSGSDSTIVAALGSRDIRIARLDSTNNVVTTDFPANCTVNFMSGSFTTVLQSVATTDACASQYTGGPSQYGSGTISPDRARYPKPSMSKGNQSVTIRAGSTSSKHSGAARPAYPHY